MTPAQLLKLSDDDPRFGRLRERGLYAEWDPQISWVDDCATATS